MTDDKRCYCGQPLHYTSYQELERVLSVIKRFGSHINIREDNGKTYRVQRHYIALHGIRGKDLGTLGFSEVVK